MSRNTHIHPASSIGHSAVLIALPILLMVCPTRSTADESDLHRKDRVALEQCHRLDDVGDLTAAGCYREFLNVAAQYAVRAEAQWRLGRFEEANRAFREAVRQGPGNPDLLARWGALFLAVHQAADAGALFEEALQLDEQHSGALLGMAELLADRFEGKADELIDQVLDDEPDNPRARLLQARLQLEVGNVDGARSTLLALIDDNQDPPHPTGRLRPAQRC